ncbi:unnamed protein product [Malus baccata var. baccata]
MSVTSVTQTVPKIPVVDFSQEGCLKPGTSSWLSIRGNVCHALEEFGCFMAVLPNKVSPELQDSMFGTLKELFDFPIETKAQTPQEKPKPEKTGTGQGLPAHTDKTFTTILHQNHVKGLEIYTKDNKWIGFDPLPSSFLFMACDGFQVWSNDRISSCKHRVNLNINEVRSSFGLFSYLEGVIRAPDELTAEDQPLKYKPLHMLDYVQFFLDNHRNVGVGCSVKEYCGI